MHLEKKTAVELLRKANLKVTKWRKALLEKIISSPHGLSYSELSQSSEFDGHRVTLYRALIDLEDAGLIEKLRDAGGTTVYMVRSNENQSHKLHPHFSCRICNLMICLTDISLPAIVLPVGYVKEQVICLVNGVCDKCTNTVA